MRSEGWPKSFVEFKSELKQIWIIIQLHYGVYTWFYTTKVIVEPKDVIIGI